MGQPGTPGKHNGSADEKYVLAAILGSDEYYNNAGGTPRTGSTRSTRIFWDERRTAAGPRTGRISWRRAERAIAMASLAAC